MKQILVIHSFRRLPKLESIANFCHFCQFRPIWQYLVNGHLTPLSKLGELGSEQVWKCLVNYFLRVCVNVTFKYVISVRVIQNSPKNFQPTAPNLFCRLISYYCIFDESSKLTGETNLFVNGFRRFVGLFLNVDASSLLGCYLTTREWQFLPHSYGKQGRIHGYPSRVRVGRGHFWGQWSIWAGAV